jgi:hypothetical protein
MTAISWAEPAPAKPRGAHRRPAEPKPRKRLLPGLRKLTRRALRTAAFEVAFLGGMALVWGWVGQIPLGILIGAVLLAAALTGLVTA